MNNYLFGNTLWTKVKTVTESALACGALKSIPTRCETRKLSIKATTTDSVLDKHQASDNHITFQVRVVKNLERKSKEIQQRAAQKPLHTPDSNKKAFNPFLPYDPDLYVGELTNHYRCLLNKFNVMDHHILMVTTEFEPQLTPLDTEDFLAAQICLQARDGLVFYNGGATAGASVEHKHLQMIPLPLSVEERFPFHHLIRQIAEPDQPLATKLPFKHRVIGTDFRDTSSLEEQREAAANNSKRYHRLLQALDLSANSDGLMTAHNLLMTRDAIWVIPRHIEAEQGLSVNALGFAGTLLVKNQEQLEQLDRIGCLELLKAVTFKN